MLENDLEIYDCCDFSDRKIPSRSCLYALKPIGIETPYVESLTSYITRLAQAHGVTISSLVSKIISSELQETFIKSCSTRNLGMFFKNSRTINSYGVIAKQLSQSLEKSTSQRNLSALSFSFLENICSTKNLHRRHKAWCPICYQESYILGHDIYDPLLWMFDDYKICLNHYQLLQTTCPYCNQTNSFLSRTSYIGYCSHCHNWLGDLLTTSNFDIYSELKLAKDISIANNLATFISSTHQHKNKLQNTNISDILIKIINVMSNGNISKFSQLFGFPKNTVWGWCKNKNLPEMKSLLTICYGLNISLVDMLTITDGQGKSLKIDYEKLPNTNNERRKSPQKLDYQKIENYLKQVLSNSKNPSPTMKEVAQKLSLDVRTIKKHFPCSCKAISKKYRQYQTNQKNQRIQECKKEIEEAILIIRQQGKNPTEARISKLISRPGYLRYKVVRNYLIQLQEL